jgi:hypothetical protein
MFLLDLGFMLRFFNGNFSLFDVAYESGVSDDITSRACTFGCEERASLSVVLCQFGLWESLVQLQKHPNILMLTS